MKDFDLWVYTNRRQYHFPLIIPDDEIAETVMLESGRENVSLIAKLQKAIIVDRKPHTVRIKRGIIDITKNSFDDCVTSDQTIIVPLNTWVAVHNETEFLTILINE